MTTFFVCAIYRSVGAEPNPTGCGLDPYVVDHDKSVCVDQQILKLQESPDDVPVGELPRHVLLSADRDLTNRVVPGSRATIMGIYSVFQTKPGVSFSFRHHAFKQVNKFVLV